MRQEILSQLTDITEEEQFILIEKAPSPKELYSRSGRFIIERRRMSSLSFGEATAAICIRKHPRFRDFPIHSHDFVEIMYVCGGSITHKIGSETVTLQADELIILGKDTRHSILSAGQNDIGINLIIATELFEDAYNKMKKSSQLSNNLHPDRSQTENTRHVDRGLHRWMAKGLDGRSHRIDGQNVKEHDVFHAHRALYNRGLIPCNENGKQRLAENINADGQRCGNRETGE